MLEKYNEAINVARKNMAEKKRIERVMRRLNSQKDDLSSRVRKLDVFRIKEDNDVAKLEKFSLSGLLLSMVGKKEEHLEKEKREAYIATMEYNDVKNELDALLDEISSIEEEYKKVSNADKSYKQAVDNKINFMKCSGTPEGELLAKYENKLLEHERLIKECTEASGACNRAMVTANRAYDCLDRANGWSNWDIMGGGFISDYAKHSNIDEAAQYMSMLQSDLVRLRSELSDINVPLDLDMDVRVSGGLKIADFMFDGLFADLSVKGHIKDSLNKVSNIQKEIMDVSAKVRCKLDNENKQREMCKQKIDEIVL